MPWAAARGPPLAGDCEQLQWPLGSPQKGLCWWEKGGGMRWPPGSFSDWDLTTASWRENLCWPLALTTYPFPHPRHPLASQAHPTAAWTAARNSPLQQTGAPTAWLSGAYMRVKVTSVISHQTPKMQNVQNSPQRPDRLPVSLWTLITAEQRRFS